MAPFDLSEQLEYYDYTEADRPALAELRPLLEKHAQGLVSAFYRHLLSFGPTRRLLADPQVKERLLVKQRAYLLSLAGPVIDDDYVRHRIAVAQHLEDTRAVLALQGFDPVQALVRGRET